RATEWSAGEEPAAPSGQSWHAGHGMAAADGARAAEIEEVRPGFFGNDFRGGEVPGFHDGLNPYFGVAASHHHGVQATPEASDGPEWLDPRKQLARKRVLVERINTGEAEDRFRDRLSPGNADADVITEGAAPARCEVRLVAARKVRHARPHFAILFEADERSPDGNAAHVVARSVDRIDDPTPPVVRRLGRALLAKQTVIRESFLKGHSDDLFAFAIRHGYG